MPALFIVASPIGNLEDITLRALRILREVSLIAAEDTRKTRRLLAKYDIKTPLTSYYEHSSTPKLDYIMDRLSTSDVALVSEAGTPGINDPGYDLIQAVIKKGIPVVPVPGPSIATTSLPVSGLPADRFLYLGFLPARSVARRRFLASLINESATLIMLESPHRIPASLQDILAIMGDRNIAVCREMTKIHEEIFRGTVRQAAAHFTVPRGEFTLVIEGKRETPKAQITADIEQRVISLHNAGISAKDAVAKLAKETGLSRKELYRIWLTTKNPR